MRGILKLLLLLAMPVQVYAVGLQDLYRGPRATAMGGAAVAAAEDEEAIFYNPAALAGVELTRFNYLPFMMEVSSDTVTTLSGSMNAYKNLSGDSLNNLMGKDIYARAQFAPSFVRPNFGISLLSDGQFALLEKNRALPQIVLGYQNTNGIQAAFGISLNGRGSTRNSTTQDGFRLGVAAKILWRRGGYHLLSLVDIMNVNRNVIAQQSGMYQTGYGGDLGLEHVHYFSNRFSLTSGAAFTNIGNVTFGGQANTIPENLSLGLAAKYKIPGISVTFAYDYRNMLDVIDWRLRNHFGLEFALPLLRLYAGFDQTFFTYGFSFDVWLIKITAVSYAEEQGALAGQEAERRYMLNLNFALPL